jgi:hypothetical protein
MLLLPMIFLRKLEKPTQLLYIFKHVNMHVNIL